MKRTVVAHEFVEVIPADPKDGVLYISIMYATAVHLCVCGCGNKVVTPISPAEWQLIYDGDSVSLTPSVGNWQFPCRSHYWIRRDKVKWAPAWTDRQIAEGRLRDSRDLKSYFAGKLPDSSADVSPTPSIPARQSIRHLLKRLLRLR